MEEIKQAAQSRAITLFMREANQKLDPHYAFKGGILTTATASQINDTIALSEMVKEVWVYRISNSGSFARLIAGKTKDAALSTLRNLPCRCVEGVSTNLPDRVKNLPTNPNRITIKIADVPGFPGSLNSTSGQAATPTSKPGLGGS